ncbi:MAG TPA: hypothetical protein VE733_15280 [Streptosporangiaceae bacterium]|jgi:hypothetical protein|nr:hypothetical protein [Streptosporangiaceae bacterium]
MHGMLKRAAASAIPALLGLAVCPASAMAAPHTGRAAARATKAASRMMHTTGTANTHRLKSTGAEFAATPANPDIPMFMPAFIAVPVYPGGGIAQLAHFSRVPGSANVFRTGSVNGAPADGVIAYGSNEKIFGNHIAASAGSGINTYQNLGNGAGIGAVSSP